MLIHLYFDKRRDAVGMLEVHLYIQSLIHAVDNFSSAEEGLPGLRYVNQLLYRQGVVFEAFGAREKIIPYTISDEQFYRMAIERAVELEDYENAAILKRALYATQCLE
ncbi:hypothetical protein [Dawidia soli]|uniref:Uncharacterized protein n=1 Tax=Dawidia soli TaxID=2782352 RepID=A0AAP2GJL0_9BACT|nr:hypothetical protein [Dawidia soli]MBT1688088.1 hypothetical protein [Dawidia soli]